MSAPRIDTGHGAVSETEAWLAPHVQRLPALPPLLRYYDDFDDATRVIHDPEGASIFTVSFNGINRHLDFSGYGHSHAALLKHLFVYLLNENLHMSTAAGYVLAAKQFSDAEILSLLRAGPEGCVATWINLRGLGKKVDAYVFVKSLLRLLCHYRLCGWSPQYQEFLGIALPLPAQDSYAGVRTGEVFLSVEEEAVIVRYLDDTAQALRDGTRLDNMKLCDTIMLLCAYQFGMRPIQIALLTMRDVRVWQDGSDASPAVHLTFRMAKQRYGAIIKPLPRRVKREWAGILAHWEKNQRQAGNAGGDRFCLVGSAQEVSQRIADLTEKLLGVRVSATDLRHTAAQRLVDAGANQEELAAFLGHASLTTGLVYYDSSPNQAERVNRAMGLSPIYQAPKTSAPHPQHRIYPYLLRHLNIERPDQVWCADVTYIPMRRGFLYLERAVELEAAAADFSEIVRRQPNNAAAYHNLGAAHAKAQRLQAAVAQVGHHPLARALADDLADASGGLNRLAAPQHLAIITHHQHMTAVFIKHLLRPARKRSQTHFTRPGRNLKRGRVRLACREN